MQYTAAQVHVSNKEVVATEKCALVEDDMPSDYEKLDLTDNVSEEYQHRLIVSKPNRAFQVQTIANLNQASQCNLYS